MAIMGTAIFWAQINPGCWGWGSVPQLCEALNNDTR